MLLLLIFNFNFFIFNIFYVWNFLRIAQNNATESTISTPLSSSSLHVYNKGEREANSVRRLDSDLPKNTVSDEVNIHMFPSTWCSSELCLVCLGLQCTQGYMEWIHFNFYVNKLLFSLCRLLDFSKQNLLSQYIRCFISLLTWFVFSLLLPQCKLYESKDLIRFTHHSIPIIRSVVLGG